MAKSVDHEADLEAAGATDVLASMDDLFSEDNIPESNWFKFVNVGDSVGGILVELRDDVQAKAPGMPNQRIFGLKQKDGNILKVGIAMTKDYIIQRTNAVKLGDLVGFKFMKEIPAKTKGYAPAKSIEVFVKPAAHPVESSEA